MSLASPYSEVYQVADGATTVFAFGQAFTPISKNYVKCIVYFQDGTSSVPEFVVNLEQGSISIVTLTTPQGELLNVIPAGAIVRIFRDVPESQDVTASQLKVMTAKQLEKSFDDIVAMIQEVSFSDQHKTLRLTETQRDVFLQKLGEAEDKAVLMWDNEKRSLVASRFTEEAIEAAIDYAVQTAEEAKVISEEAKTISQNALLTAEEARVKSQDAIDTSLTALNTANEANDKSDRAVADSLQAVNIANQANTKSDEAKSIAQEANTKSNQAVATANSAEAKADQAVATSQEALADVQSAVEAAETATIAAQQATEAAEAATEAVASKQDKLTAGNGVDITNNVVSTNTQFVITEDMFDIAFDDTKGVAPYNTSYGYTNVTIHDDEGIEWIEGAMYSFVLDTKVATSTYRNVRVRIGEDGDWKPMMVTSSIAAGSTVFVKAVNSVFFYKTTYQANGALHCLYDSNTTYTINYSIDAGQKRAGVGAYAVSRYSLIMEKPDGTWEKITDTTKNYTTGTSKTVNKNGFLLNQIKYYNYTTNYANGALISASYVYSKSASANGSYSFNCGTAPGWAIGTIIYLVGTVSEEDGLFYLDETQWWATSLPTSKDGKLYIQLGVALTATDSTFSFWDDRPVFYYDNGIKLYGGGSGASEWGKIGGTLSNQTDLQTALNAKQDTLPDGTAGQILKKTADGVEWADESGGTITDVQVDSTSVVTGGVANITLSGKQDKTDNDLATVSKTVVGAINELDTKVEEIEAARFPNAVIIGEPTISQGQVSNFTTANYLQFPFVVDLTNRRFTAEFCFTTGDDVTTQQNILDSQFGLALAIANGKGLMAISHNGTSWAGSVVGTMTISPNTTYYAKLSWNRINYQTQLSTDGTTYTPDMNFGSTQSPYPRTMFIGGCSGTAIGHTAHPFKGTINLNKCRLYIEDVEVWQGMDDVGLATRATVSLDNLDSRGEARFDAKQNVVTYDATTKTLKF